jgi:hypothetical protein
MIKEIWIKSALFWKTAWGIPGILLCAILVVIGVEKSHGSVNQDAGSIPLLTAKDIYAVQSSQLKKNEAPWLFDGERQADGKVVAIWDADTDANKSACANEWKESATYRPLCMDLKNQKIISVDVSGLNTPLVTYVPVSRVAKVEISDQVRIKMGEISGDKVTRLLPSFVRVLRDTDKRKAGH